MKRSLGFLGPVPVSPSPDPVSIALDVIAGIAGVVALFQERKHRRQAQENEVVQVQNQLGTSLDSISAAAQDPNATVEQLVTLGNHVEDLAKKFYDYTLGFSIAGPGARQTIFGDEVSPGVFTTTDAHPGWLTRLLDFIKTRIGEKGGMAPQLGFDWSSLENTLLKVGAGIVNQAIGRPTVQVVGGGAQTPYQFPTQVQLPNLQQVPPAGQEIPSWVWPAGIGLLALIVVTSATSRR